MDMATSRARTNRSDDRAVEPFQAFLAKTAGEPVYVILGVQGSGTNLLRSILVRAFDFSVIQDQSLVLNAGLRLGHAPSPAAVRRELHAIESRLLPSTLVRKMRRRIKSNASFEGFGAHAKGARITSGAEFARFVYTYAAYTQGTTRMAIKSDDLWESIDRIDDVLTNRRIILLTRDFRDNLLSITKKEFGPVDPLISARYVKERFSHYAALFNRTPSAQRFHVRYEDLLDSPDAFVRDIGTHFGLSGGAAPPAVDKSRIRRNNTKKWSVLTGRELALCEAILREELQTYGYGTESEPVAPPGPGTWMAARANDVARRIPQKFKNILRRLRK
jgi:hypothetical protein